MPRPRPPSNRGHVAMLKSGSMMLDWKTGQLLNYKIVFFSTYSSGADEFVACLLVRLQSKKLSSFIE